MLYDAETSLSRDTQSSCEAETILARELARLEATKPSSALPQKQRLLHFLQEKHLRLPHVVVKYGSQLLKNASRSLGNSVWDLYERVCIAALDAHDYPVSRWCLSVLKHQWPGSTRVARLQGMASEARGHFSAADELYTEYLADDPTNMSLHRRQIACAKGAGDLPRAISLLNAYLKNFASDENAWLELSELYLQTQQYDLAAFVLEELLMLTPESYVYQCKYADLQYTLGHMDLARQYYAQSLELKPNNNLRALYGLATTLKTKAGQTNAPNPTQLWDWTAQQLLAHYKKYQPHLIECAKVTLGESTNVAAAAAPATAAPTAAPAAPAVTNVASAGTTFHATATASQPPTVIAAQAAAATAATLTAEADLPD